MKAFKILGIILFIFNFIWTLFNNLALNFYLKASLFDYFHNNLFWTDFCFCFLLIFGFIALICNKKFLLFAFFLLFIFPFDHHARMINMYFLNNMPVWLLDMFIQGILYCLLLAYTAIYLAFIFYHQELLTITSRNYKKFGIGLALIAFGWSIIHTKYYLYLFGSFTTEIYDTILQNEYVYVLELIIFFSGVIYNNKFLLITGLGIFTYYLIGNLFALAGFLLPFTFFRLEPGITGLLNILIWFYLLILLTNHRYKLFKIVPAKLNNS